MLAIRLSQDIEARMDALAKATGRTKTFYARQAIVEHLDDLEDLYLAEHELEAIRGDPDQREACRLLLSADDAGVVEIEPVVAGIELDRTDPTLT